MSSHIAHGSGSIVVHSPCYVITDLELIMFLANDWNGNRQMFTAAVNIAVALFLLELLELLAVIRPQVITPQNVTTSLECDRPSQCLFTLLWYTHKVLI